MSKLLVGFFLIITHLEQISGQTMPTSSIFLSIQHAQKIAAAQPDTAIFLAQKAYLAAMDADSFLLAFKALRSMGYWHEENGNYDAAKTAYQRAVELAEVHLPVQQLLLIYTDWAIIHKKTGNFEVAKTYHQRTIEMGTKLKIWEAVENGYHGLGTMYSMFSDFEKSHECYLQSIEAAQKWGNKKGVVLTQQNIANIFMKAKNYEMARKNIEIAQKMAIELGDSNRLATVLKICGNILLATDSLNQALEKQLVALSIFQKSGNKTQQSEVWLALGEIYLRQKNWAAAENAQNQCLQLENYFSPYTHAAFHLQRGNLFLEKQYFRAALRAFQLSLQKTEKYGFREIVRDNHLALAKTYHFLGENKAAFEHALAANQAAEAIFAEEKQRTMTEAKFKYDLSQRDFQIANQQQKIQRDFYTRLFLGIGLALVSGLFFFSRHQTRLKQRALAQSELLMKELHHRVKNNLQTITSLMRIQARQVHDEGVAAVLNESRARLEMIALLHQQLYKNDTVKTVNMSDFVKSLIEKMRFTYNFDKKPLEVQLDFQPEMLDVDKALPLGLIINELLTNAFKYAFWAQDKPRIHISFSEKKMVFSDNGIGYPEGFAPQSTDTFGFELIGALVEQLRGSFTVGNQNGGHFQMNFS